jgi:hypothetical protein
MSFPTRACSKCEKLYPFNKKFFEPRAGGTGLRNVCKGCYSAQRAERRKANKPAPPELQGETFWNAAQAGDWITGTVNVKYIGEGWDGVDDVGWHILEIGSGRDAKGINGGEELSSYVTCEVDDTIWNLVEQGNTVKIWRGDDGVQRLEILNYGWRNTPSAGPHDKRVDVRNRVEKDTLRKKEAGSGVR